MESGRGKLPGNVFSSVTLWLTQNHPRSISRARRKAYATRGSICSAYRVSRRGLNFHTLIKLKPSTFSHYIFEHNRSQATAAPVLPDEGSSNLTGGAGELFKHQFIFDQLRTAIVHVTDRQRGAGIEGYAFGGKAADVRAPGGAPCPPTAAPDSLSPQYSLLMHGVWAKEVGTGSSACCHGTSKCHVSVFLNEIYSLHALSRQQKVIYFFRTKA